MIPLKDNVPLRVYPFMTIILVLLNVLVFVLEIQQGPRAGETLLRYAAVPSQVLNWPSQPTVLLTLLTGQFLHAGFVHLLGNMVYLWVFGRKVEDALGPWRFLFFYLLGGVLAGMVDAIFSFRSDVPTVGASGGIATVLGAYMLLYPWARVWVWFPLAFWTIFPVPAFLALGFWFALQLFSGVASLDFGASQAGGVAWWAHIGGFVGGMLVGLMLRWRARRDYRP